MEAVGNNEAWNWAFVGADPVNLPLVGGGDGGFDEMQECYEGLSGDHVNIYGLLRMDFGSDSGGVSRWVFIRASNSEDTTKMSVIKRGQQKALAGAMQSAVSEICQTHATVQVTCPDEFDWNDFVERLKKSAPQHASMFTRDVYEDTLTERKKGQDEKAMKRMGTRLRRTMTAADRENRAASLMRTKTAPACDSAADVQEKDDAPPEPDSDAEFDETVPPPPKEDQASSSTGAEVATSAGPITSIFKKGQPVFAYFSAEKDWLDDGVVTEVLQEQQMVDGQAIPPGSVKVKYNKNKNFRWLLPGQELTFIRPSPRPAPPVSLSGELYKELHGATSRKKVFFCNITDGYLQWWHTKQEAKSGVKRQGQICLLDMEVKVEGCRFWVKTAETKGLLHGFDATNQAVLDAWITGFKAHSTYSKDIMRHMAEQEKKKKQAIAAKTNKAMAASAAPAAAKKQAKGSKKR